MVIKSLSDIPSALFYRLKTWAEYSNANWMFTLKKLAKKMNIRKKSITSPPLRCC